MEIWSKCDICGRDIPVGELCYGLKKGNCICKNCCTGFENCTFTLAPMPTLTPPNEWVSVEDRLPEKGENVLVYAIAKHIGVTKISIDKLEEGERRPVWLYTHGWFEVTNWMPLPAPPDRRPPEGEEAGNG